MRAERRHRPARAGATRRAFAAALAGWALLAGVGEAEAHGGPADQLPAPLRDVAFEQRLDAQVPLGLAFRDETGRAIRFGEALGAKPAILALVYYRCDSLCPLVLEGLVRTLRAVAFDAGDQFRVVAVSFDPREGPADAAAVKAQALRRYGRPGTAAGWSFLTGDAEAIRRLAAAVGFRYTVDAAQGRFAHAAGVVVLTPQGRASRYFYGIEFSPRDLRLGLVEAAAQRIGTLVDQLLLFCYHYDPATGRYGVLVMTILRLAAALTVALLGAVILLWLRRERRGAPSPCNPLAPSGERGG